MYIYNITAARDSISSQLVSSGQGNRYGTENAGGTARPSRTKSQLPGNFPLASQAMLGQPSSLRPHWVKHGRMNYKDTKPYMSAFLKIGLLTDFATLCLTDFIDWRYIHSVVCIFDPAL